MIRSSPDTRQRNLHFPKATIYQSADENVKRGNPGKNKSKNKTGLQYKLKNIELLKESERHQDNFNFFKVQGTIFK